jgi:serine protease Do
MRGFKLSIFVLFIAATLTMTGLWTATIPAKTKADETVSVSYGDKLEVHFKQAQKDIQKDDYAGAATQIREGASILKEAAGDAESGVRNTLLISAEDLEVLAEGLETNVVYSSEKIQRTFAHAHQAMAGYYDFKASESWAKNAVDQVADNLKGVADHLEDTMAWLGRKTEAGTQTVISYARQLSHQLKAGTGYIADEVSKDIKEIHREVAKLKGANSDESEGPLKIVPVQPEAMVGIGQDLTGAFMRVAKAVIPSVVQIRVTERREVPNPFLPFQGNPLFRQYFGLPKKMPKKFKEELKGLGTGMIVDPDGYILTNNHVVGGATEIEVLLANGEEYSAKVIGTDPKTDLGVIKIDANKPLPCVTFADSDMVQVGQWVVAIGHPRGLDQTVTQGIISGKHRTGITNPSGYQDFLQTDAPINPGNSGGPLLTLQGQVIGVNSAIATQSGGFEGLGFAIPSDMAVHVANELIAYGKVERGWLGVTIQELTSDLAKSFGLTIPSGALIGDVMKGGPGEKAGLKRGDVILEYQGQKIDDASELRNKVAGTPLGKKVELTVWRDKKKIALTAVIGNLEELTDRLTALVKERLGVTVGPVTPEQAANYGLRSPMGVDIQWVDPNGVLGKVGFEVGDLILAVGKLPVEGVDSFLNMVSHLPHHQKIVLLALDHRSSQTSYVQIESP